MAKECFAVSLELGFAPIEARAPNVAKPSTQVYPQVIRKDEPFSPHPLLSELDMQGGLIFWTSMDKEDHDRIDWPCRSKLLLAHSGSARISDFDSPGAICEIDEAGGYVSVSARENCAGLIGHRVTLR